VGVWGTPIEVASRAADIVAALPTAQLLKRRYSSRHPIGIHRKMLLVSMDACKLLNYEQVVPPYMSREKLLGRCWPV
jgi:hypothetical protein